jgi:hypothetical protein
VVVEEKFVDRAELTISRSEAIAADFARAAQVIVAVHRGTRLLRALLRSGTLLLLIRPLRSRPGLCGCARDVHERRRSSASRPTLYVGRRLPLRRSSTNLTAPQVRYADAVAAHA